MMERAFSDKVVHSSAVEEVFSSGEEDDPLNLSGNELKKSLKHIPPFNKLFSITAVKEKRSGNWHFNYVKIINRHNI